jgi:chromate transport protein ChrA
MDKLKKYYGFTIALLFFSLGTFLLLIYLVTKNENILLTGYFYVIFSIIVNSIIEIILLTKLVIKKKKRKEVFINMIFIICNIPIAYLYFLIVLTNAKL